MLRHVVVVSAIAAAVLARPVAAAPPAWTQQPQPAHAYAVSPVPGTVVRPFDPPSSPYAAGHRGVDLVASAGEPVVASMGGTVTFSGTVALVGWVTVDHGGGLQTTYGPVSPRTVGAGDAVHGGDVVGFVADHAAHLDWGARLDGAYIDPLMLLARWETYLTTDDDTSAPPLGGSAAVTTAAGPTLRWPLRGVVTSPFGPRVHPVTGEHRHHAGIDIAGGHGTSVAAAASGTVTFAGAVSGYGNTVVVDHGAGVSTLYAHLGAVDVVAGERVHQGDRVGGVGATGTATGPHLHFEVRRGGVPLDPRPVLSR